ncbi:hypothetical protein B0H13DRAFT_719294 [Mycena leptocephala]|nr:hypothetical protein B0H13DRAFT_719294 [Mycena leptocephala]
MVWTYISRYDVSSASMPTPLAPPFFLPLPAALRHPRRRHLHVALLVTCLRMVVGLHRHTLARCPPHGTPLPSPPSPRCLRRSHRPRHPHTHRFTGETSSTIHIICANFQSFYCESRRCSKLEWRGAGIDPTSAVRMGAPTTMRVRESGEQWTMGAEDASTSRSRGTCGWEAHGWGVGGLEPRTVGSRRALRLTQIVACRRRPPTRARVFSPPQDGRYLPPCKRNPSSMHERVPLAEGHARLGYPYLYATPPHQCPSSNIRSRRPHRAPVGRCFSPRLGRHRLSPTPAPQP